MDKYEASGSARRVPSLFVQTNEDSAKTVVAVASAATIRSPRPSVVFSSKDDSSNSQIQKLQRHFSRVLKGFSPPPDVRKAAYNPEILTSQKRQWASFQMQSLDQRLVREPSQIFESMVVVGLHPNADIRALEKFVVSRNFDDQKKVRSFLNNHHQVHAELSPEPQVLFVYPPEKQLPLKYKDLLSFCFPGGLEVRIIERTPSMSELNEVLLGQEQLKQSDLSFVFRLQVADDSTLYGCCIYIEELVQKPSGLISMLSEEQTLHLPLRRHIITTPRCYCILSRLPFFDLHFGVLRSIFTEERFERLTKGMDMINLLSAEYDYGKAEDEFFNSRQENFSNDPEVRILKSSNSGPVVPYPLDVGIHGEPTSVKPLENLNSEEIKKIDASIELRDSYTESYCDVANQNCPVDFDGEVLRVRQSEKQFPEAVLPLLRYQQRESSGSSISFQDSPYEERSFQSVNNDTEPEEPSSLGHEERSLRSGNNDTEPEEPSSSGHEDFSDHNGIMDWAKANNHGALQIICEYYKLQCPARGSKMTFHPLPHLNPLEFCRPAEIILQVSGSTIDLRAHNSSLEFSEAHSALLAEEEATALSVWTIACICGSLRLENVLALFAGALLEKQIVIVCSNLGVLSASVLSIVPLIRPYQWQSLLMPVLPNDMLDFLDAPVPYIVGIKIKTNELQSRLTNVILVDVNKNQVKSPSMPPLPQRKELLSSLSPYHAKLVGESYLARKRPVYECTDVQVEAAKGFLAVLRSYLDSLCSNLRSHTITNVQSNDDKVSLLLKESFIDSFPSRDRPFMKLFVDTQLFSVHTDLVLSFYQKD